MKLIFESLVVACLLLTNVVMGNFTHGALASNVDWTVMDRILDALTVQNIFIAFGAGVIASFLIWNVIRKES